MPDKLNLNIFGRVYQSFSSVVQTILKCGGLKQQVFICSLFCNLVPSQIGGYSDGKLVCAEADVEFKSKGKV